MVLAECNGAVTATSCTNDQTPPYPVVAPWLLQVWNIRLCMSVRGQCLSLTETRLQVFMLDQSGSGQGREWVIFKLPFQLCLLCLQVTFILSIRLSSNIINTSHQRMPAMVQWPFSLGIVSHLTLKSTRHVSFEGSARLVGGSMWRPRPVFNA